MTKSAEVNSYNDHLSQTLWLTFVSGMGILFNYSQKLSEIFMQITNTWKKNNFWVNFHRELGSYLIFIAPLIACHNYNLGLKKGFGINWINLAAISWACMLICSTPPLEKNLIKYTNDTFKPHRKGSMTKRPRAGWNKKNCVISNLNWSEEDDCLMTAGLKCLNTHSYLFSSKCFFILTLFLPLLRLSLDCSHTPTRARINRAANPLCGLPTCSRGRRWLKQWQVDSTLKLSIDPRELNQTAKLPSLSVQARSGTKGKDTWRVRGQSPPLHPHCTS